MRGLVEELHVVTEKHTKYKNAKKNEKFVINEYDENKKILFSLQVVVQPSDHHQRSMDLVKAIGTVVRKSPENVRPGNLRTPGSKDPRTPRTLVGR